MLVVTGIVNDKSFDDKTFTLVRFSINHESFPANFYWKQQGMYH